ncbi:MAG: RHS repeat-associated core domain-containing protein [Phycisphaerae bacterium]
MVMELDCGTGTTPVNTVLRKYTWGRDLGGGLESAGGIGGLLAVEDTNATPATTDDQSLAFLYDANGNVGQVVDWAQTTASAALKAKYEYDVYGNVTASGGSYATANPFRFSTKYWDDETGLGYWGYRYYEPRMGRWVSRDPYQEEGGKHLLAYAFNDPCNRSDSLGELSVVSPGTAASAAAASCTCTAEIKASGLHLYIHFEQSGCKENYKGNAHWGPCGLIGMCPRGSIDPQPNPKQSRAGNSFSSSSGPWGDTGGPADGGGGPQTFKPMLGGNNACECLKNIMDAKYPTYFVCGPNSNSAAMEAAKKCGLDTSGVTGYPGQGLSPGTPVSGGL